MQGPVTHFPKKPMLLALPAKSNEFLQFASTVK